MVLVYSILLSLYPALECVIGTQCLFNADDAQLYLSAWLHSAADHFRNIDTMVNLLAPHDAEKLPHAFRASSLRCWNILLAACPTVSLRNVHSVQNAAACLFTRKIKSEPITPVLFKLMLYLGPNYQSCIQHKQYNTWKSVITLQFPYHHDHYSQVGRKRDRKREKERADTKENKQVKINELFTP